MTASIGSDPGQSSARQAVVAGIDGSETSTNAARWAASLAHHLRTPLHLVHSAVTAGSYLTDAAVEAIKAAATADQYAAAQNILTMTGKAVHRDFPELPVTTEVVAEPADTVLIRRSRQAQFVVLGCEDISRATALLLGSTSLSVTTRAECPVIAWRNLPAPSTASVVVGVDGTEAGMAALAAAFTLADRLDAPVKAVHAWSTALPADHAALPYLIDWDAVERAEETVLISAVSPWTERFPGVEVEYVVEQARPSRLLLDHLKYAQLVVVGNHRGSALATALLGSTTLNMLHHSPVPVLVCHAEDRPGL
ncbi:universal stress protein [Mycolicibacterium mengxianglii]|uniref:universal stress protein n=1 Tax=Mycolicibacterium mengxianglii TaxID=2736649 RepID=UPI0018D0A79F|nr:universal stress protein [Mycolicibacterium mengxianglii]